MLPISKAFTRGIGLSLHSRAQARTLPLLLPRAATTQWIRQKHNRHPPPRGPQNAPHSSVRSTLNPRDLQHNPNKTGRRVGSPAAESSRQDRLSEESADFDSNSRPARNTATEFQPGPGQTKQVPPGKDEASPQADDAPSESFEQPATSKPLPDLRHGIPSTFAQDFLNQKASPQPDGSTATAHDAPNITDDPRSSGEASGREEGELPKSAYKTSIDKRRERMAFWLYISFGLAAAVNGFYFGRNWDTEEEERAHIADAPSGWGLKLFYDRIIARVSGQMGYYTEPTFPKLLPDIDPAPPYTLVLSLEDLMIHSEWTREHGWRTAKRPGVDYFLGYLSQYFELVLFTSLPVSAADQIVRKLDPYHFMTFPLFREATRYEKGQYVKDLSYLNRPLSKTILVDTKAEHAKSQPENAIILKAWKGEAQDKELVALIPFLEQIAAMGLPDVRAALKSYEGKHIPTEFALREAKAREEFNRQLAEEKARKPKRSGLGFLNSALGMKPTGGGMSFDGAHSVAEGLAEGKMLADQIRESGIKRYKELEKEIRENGEKWLKEEAEMEKKMQAEQMKSMKTGALSFWGGGGKAEGTN